MVGVAAPSYSTWEEREKRRERGGGEEERGGGEEEREKEERGGGERRKGGLQSNHMKYQCTQSVYSRTEEALFAAETTPETSGLGYTSTTACMTQTTGGVGRG